MLEILIQIVPVLLSIALFTLVFCIFILICKQSKRSITRSYPSIRPRVPYGTPEKRSPIQYSPVTPSSKQHQKKPAKPPKAEVKKPPITPVVHPVENSTPNSPAAPSPSPQKPSTPIPDSIDLTALKKLATPKSAIAVNRWPLTKFCYCCMMIAAQPIDSLHKSA